jgi:hypothetical protein
VCADHRNSVCGDRKERHAPQISARQGARNSIRSRGMRCSLGVRSLFLYL